MFNFKSLMKIRQYLLLIPQARILLSQQTSALQPGSFIQYLVALVFLLPAMAQAALPFAVAQVQYKEVDQTYAAEALVEAVNQATVSAQISGRIVEINFDAGDVVSKGQVLMRIDEREASQALEDEIKGNGVSFWSRTRNISCE